MKKKLEWCGYPTAKKNFEDMFIRFEMIHERDIRTPHEGYSRAYA